MPRQSHSDRLNEFWIQHKSEDRGDLEIQWRGRGGWRAYGEAWSDDGEYLGRNHVEAMDWLRRMV